MSSDIVWLRNGAASRRSAIIVAQQPTQTIATPHPTAVAPKVRLGRDALVGKALMIPLGMIMPEVRVDRIVQRPLVQHHHLRQRFLFDGVWSKNSCGLALVVFQESAEPFSIVNWACTPFVCS